MANVYFCPGFGGSSLLYPAASNAEVWLSYFAMTLGSIRLMRLAGDGVNPGEPYGRRLIAGAPLPTYFGPFFSAFQAQLSRQGDVLIPRGYDWRMSADLAGLALADTISANDAAGSPCTIVGYSFGCLIARRAWWYLSRRGEAARVRRVVLVGGPNYGCYHGVNLWAKQSSTLDQLALLSNINPASSLVAGFIGEGFVVTEDEIVNVSMTWPGLYEAMPALAAPDAAADPLRPILYEPAWPYNFQPSQAWLEYAKLVWQPWLLSAASVPPPAVLTCVAGTGTPTAYRLNPGGNLDSRGKYAITNEGDGAVTVVQNLLPGAAAVLLNASHADMYDTLVDSGTLLALVNDPRVPPQPAPPAVNQPGIVPAYRQDAPLPPTVFSGQLALPVGRYQLGCDP